MTLLIGAGLGLAVGALGALVGFDRGRSYYAVILIVIATYYGLFAIMAGAPGALVPEALVLGGFLLAAVIGFRANLWLVVVGLLAHGGLDLIHGHIIDNPGVPAWWPGFCLACDVALAACLALRLATTRARADDAAAATRPRRRALLAAVLAAGASFGSDSIAAERSEVRFAQADGHAVAYRVAGHGAPVLVLISGLGDGMASFDGVVDDLARSATVIVYDRAGYGRSGDPQGVRDAAAADRELSDLLRASGVKGPYVVGGHSIGGQYAEYFAGRHPGEVSGLILIDSRPADFTAACAQAGLAMCVATPEMLRFAPKGAQAEVAALAETAAEVAALKEGSNLPTLVLSRAVSARPKPIDALWAQSQQALAARYPGSRQQTAPGGGHYIHKTARDWFVAQVSGFLQDHR